MHHNVESQHLNAALKASVAAELATRIEKLRKRLAALPDDTVFLHGRVEKHPRRKRFRVALTLHLPKRVLTAREEGEVCEAVVAAAWRELERQLNRHLAFLRQEHLWRRPARRRQLRSQKAEPSPTPPREDPEPYLCLIEPHLKKLYNFVRREIAYFQATGDLLPGDVTARDVVDAVVLQGYREWRRRPADLPLDRWLIMLAMASLGSEILRRKAERDNAVTIEAPAPPDAAREVVTLGDEIYEFYQPDERLRLEDLVPDPYVPSPEDVMTSRELQRYLNQTLAQLPQQWRHAFVLHHVEGFSPAEVARIMGLNEADVEQALTHAREFLRQKLQDTDLTPLPGHAEAATELFASTADVDIPEALRRDLADRLRSEPQPA